MVSEIETSVAGRAATDLAEWTRFNVVMKSSKESKLQSLLTL